MATYEEIIVALRNADAAGDTAAATRLAAMARAAKAQAPAEAQKAEEAPERGIRQRIYDNVIGDPTDGVQSTGEALGTWLNRAGESATLGVVGDEASAAAIAPVKRLVGGDATYESELARFRKNEDDMSTMGRLSADLTGALVPGAGIAGGVARGGNVLAKVGRGALAGGVSGGIQGFAEGEGGAGQRVGNASTNALLGAAIGGVVPAVGAGVRSVAEGRAARKAVSNAGRGAPSSDELRALGGDLYRQVDEAGVQVKPESFSRATDEIRDYLRANTGFDELPGPGSLTPNTARVMSIMDEASARMAQDPTAALPFRSLDQMRRQAGAAAGNVINKTDQKAGMSVIEQLDDFVQRLGPDDVVSGDAEALKSAIGKAREVWSRMSRSQMIDDAMDRSENYLSGSASGIRNQFKSILQNKKLAAQFSDAEKAALRQVTHGSTLDQLINLAGGGLAQLGSIGGGFSMGGPAGGLIGAAAAAGQRKLSEAVTMRAAERARAAIASGQLHNPQAANALAIAGRRPEYITNALGFGALPSVTGGQPGR